MVVPVYPQEFWDGPALAPPPGVTPNFINPPNLKIVGLVIIGLCLIISTLVTVIRVYMKLRLFKRLDLEDYWLLATWLVYAGGYHVISFIVSAYAPGIHQWDMQMKDLSRYLFHVHVAQIIYGVVILMLKVAILTQFLKLFVAPGRKDLTYWACHGLIWVNVVFYTLEFFVQIFACSPIDKFWKPLMEGGKCMDKFAILIATAAVNTLSDIIILLIPQRVIWDLQLATARRSALSALFLVGIIGCTAATVRLYYSIRMSQTDDVTYFSAIMGICSYPEMASGFLVLCTPIMPKFFKRVAHKPVVTTGIDKIRTMFQKKGNRHSPGSVHNEKNQVSQNRWGTFRTKPHEPPFYKAFAESEELVNGANSGDSGSNRSEATSIQPPPKVARPIRKIRRPIIRARRADGSDPKDSQIVRTVEIASVVESKSEADEEAEFERHHPWSRGMGLTSTKTSAQTSSTRSWDTDITVPELQDVGHAL